MRRFLQAMLIAILITACGRQESTSTPPVADQATVTGAEEIDDMSIYQLTTSWRTQDNDEITFKDLNGEVLVVVMIYTSCQSACPRLVEDMKSIESKVSASIPSGVRYVFVSIDPTYDTPERLKAFSIENGM